MTNLEKFLSEMAAGVEEVATDIDRGQFGAAGGNARDYASQLRAASEAVNDQTEHVNWAGIDNDIGVSIDFKEVARRALREEADRITATLSDLSGQEYHAANARAIELDQIARAL